VIETIRPQATARCARVALFDFDGTLSLIRSGWMEVMTPMMVEILADLKSGETEQQLRAVVEEFVWKLTGKETIYQMIALADEIRERGGAPKDPLEYKKMYLDRLWLRIEGRVEDLKQRRVSPDDYLVPGSRQLLEALRERGLKMYLASGTDDVYLHQEARLLDIGRYFDGGVYGALDDYKSFSKGILIQRILATAEYSGSEFLGFGDGYVEIEEVRKVGGITVGVASQEPECETVDAWKRERLIGAGADHVVPNFLDLDRLLAVLFGET
jgi:phosphoglycolate phosphatase-like HAD superfamily hydrolase